MPVTRVALPAAVLVLLALIMPAAAVAQSEECVEITQPHHPAPPNEVTVGMYCPGDDDGDGPPPATPVGGGGDAGGGGGGGPVCSWTPSPVHESEIRNGGESWWRYYYQCDDGTSGETWLCQNCSAEAEDPEPDWQAIQQELLLEATASIDLPGPRLRHLYDSAPDGRVLGVVRAESWWWTETADRVTARAEDGPLWVEVTAQPHTLEVDPGDGSPAVSCPGGGTPYDFSRSYYAQQGSSDCFHVYQRTSAGEPDEAFTVTATLTWELAWISGGPIDGSGTLPPDASSESFALPVGELQSVVSR